MKNSGEPINPTYFKDKELNSLGLTKREYFAGLAMQGMVAAKCGDYKDDHKEWIAKLAISQADELLKQLESCKTDN